MPDSDRTPNDASPPADSASAKPSDAPAHPPPAPLIGWLAEIRIATAFLTTLPLPLSPTDAAQPVGAAVRAFPLVGVVIGGAGAAVYALADLLGLASGLAAILAIAAMMALTGGLHEDGLADTADGLGGRERTARLAIMHDSRIGTYGVLALLIVVLIRIDAVSYVGSPGEVLRFLVAAAAGSRASMPAIMYMLHPARAEGMGYQAGRPDHRRAVDAGVLGATIVVLTIGPIAGLAAIAAAAMATVALGWLAQRRLGGFTGDTLGATQQMSEIAIILAYLATPFA
jgi:adenosylcobinamide-GDP ribazoletransferase